MGFTTPGVGAGAFGRTGLTRLVGEAGIADLAIAFVLAGVAALLDPPPNQPLMLLHQPPP